MHPWVERGALNGPVAGTPGVIRRHQPVDIELGGVVRRADVGRERGIAVVDDVLVEDVVGRVLPFRQRADEEELELVLDALVVLTVELRDSKSVAFSDSRMSFSLPPGLKATSCEPLPNVRKGSFPFSSFSAADCSLKYSEKNVQSTVT